MVILYSSRFQRNFKKLPKKVKIKVVDKVKILEKNPLDSSLRIHKLHGSEYFSLWIEYDSRVLFKRDKQKIILLDLGDHDSIYRN